MRASMRRAQTREDRRHDPSGADRTRDGMGRGARRSERGIAAVEMAIVAPVLVTLVAGIVDFGFRYQQHIAYTNAAMQSARSMSISNSVATATTAGRDVVANPTATVTVSTGGCGTGITNVKVEVKATRNTLTGLFGKTFTVKGTGQVRCE